MQSALETQRHLPDLAHLVVKDPVALDLDAFQRGDALVRASKASRGVRRLRAR